MSIFHKSMSHSVHLYWTFLLLLPLFAANILCTCLPSLTERTPHKVTRAREKKPKKKRKTRRKKSPGQVQLSHWHWKFLSHIIFSIALSILILRALLCTCVLSALLGHIRTLIYNFNSPSCKKPWLQWPQWTTLSSSFNSKRRLEKRFPMSPTGALILSR